MHYPQYFIWNFLLLEESGFREIKLCNRGESNFQTTHELCKKDFLNRQVRFGNVCVMATHYSFTQVSEATSRRSHNFQSFALFVFFQTAMHIEIWLSWCLNKFSSSVTYNEVGSVFQSLFCVWLYVRYKQQAIRNKKRTIKETKKLCLLIHARTLVPYTLCTAMYVLRAAYTLTSSVFACFFLLQHVYIFRFSLKLFIHLLVLICALKSLKVKILYHIKIGRGDSFGTHLPRF